MKKILLFLLLYVSNITYAQQESKIKIDSGNGNQVTVMQQGKDSAQKSDVDIEHGNNNKLNVNQAKDGPVKKEDGPQGFMAFVSKTNVVVALLISIATFLGLLKGLPFIKKMSEKK